jgi:hypothetical protein
MAAAAIVWYLVFQLFVLGIKCSPTLDAAAWAADRCQVKGMDGGPWTKAQTRCFDLHGENATAEAAEPYRLLSTRRNVPLMLSVGLLAVSGIGLILEPCYRDKRSGSHRSTPRVPIRS